MGRSLRDLADLEEVAVRVPEEAADLSAPVDRRCQEDGTTGRERLVGGAAVGYLTLFTSSRRPLLSCVFRKEHFKLSDGVSPLRILVA